MAASSTTRSEVALTEMRDLQEHPIVGIKINAVRGNTSKWRITVNGPDNTAYKGRQFILNLDIPHNYPDELPILKFASRFVHPDVGADGRVTFIRRPEGQSTTGEGIPTNNSCIRQTLMQVLSYFTFTPDPMILNAELEESERYLRYLRRYDELYELHEKPVKGMHIITKPNNDLNKWKFFMFGSPESGVYARSFFSGWLEFPPNYPDEAPKVYFDKDFQHPLIQVEQGEQCKDRYYVTHRVLKHWNQGRRKIRDVLQALVNFIKVSVSENVDRQSLEAIVAQSRVFASEPTKDFPEGFPIPATMEDYDRLSVVRVPFTTSEEH